MINSGHIPIRYAKALYEFANQSDVQLKLYDEIRIILKNIATYSSFRKTMLNPVFNVSEKKALISKAFGINVSAELNGFVDLIIKNKRESILPQILIRYQDYYRERNNILNSKLITSVSVDKNTYKRLFTMVEKITSARIEMETVVDPSIIGGFVLEVDNLRWEASIANELEKIKKGFQVKNKRISE